MCIDVIRSPVSAVLAAKKRKNMSKTWLTLFEASALFGLASAVFVLRSNPAAVSLAAVSALSVLAVILLLSILLGFVLRIIVSNLGGKGKYYESLTSISYALAPISVASFVGSLLGVLPGGVILSSVALALGFASGISILYRSIKELFATDLITALVAVSIVIIVLFVTASASFGLATLTRFGSLFG